MLVKVILPTGEPVGYEYDGNRRLISRKSSDGVDNFVQSGWDIVTKMDDVGKRTYYTGSSVVESEDSVKYFHYNHRGDTVLVTDANGEILHNLNYEAYGRPTNNEGIPINTLSLTNATDPGNSSGGSGNNLPNLFVGASGIRYDTKTNLHYMRFRWFSGEQMRFISADLLMDLNRYAYVSGDPINNFDPMGLLEITVVDGVWPVNIHPRDEKVTVEHTQVYSLYRSKMFKAGKEKNTIPQDTQEIDKLKGILSNYYIDYVNNQRLDASSSAEAIADFPYRDNFIQNCHGFALGGGENVYISGEEAAKILESNSYNGIFDSSKKADLNNQIAELKNKLRVGDVITFRGENSKFPDHTVTVAGVCNGNVLIIERDGIGAVYLVSLRDLRSNHYGGRFNAYRPTKNWPRYNGVSKSPFEWMMKKYQPQIQDWLNRCKASQELSKRINKLKAKTSNL